MVGPGLGDNRAVQGELVEGHTGSARGDRGRENLPGPGSSCPADTRCLGFRWEGLWQLVSGEADVGSGAYKHRCLREAGWEMVWTQQRVAWLSNERIFPKERERAEWEVWTALDKGQSSQVKSVVGPGGAGGPRLGPPSAAEAENGI